VSIKIQLGSKMSAEDAKKAVDGLYRKVADRWGKEVNGTAFMAQLREGKLPRKVLQVFFRN